MSTSDLGRMSNTVGVASPGVEAAHAGECLVFRRPGAPARLHGKIFAAAAILLATVTAMAPAQVGGVGGERGEKASIAIVDLSSDFDSGTMGAFAGYSLRAKLRRGGACAIPEELDIYDAMGSGAAPGADDVSEARALAERLGTRVIVWGEVVAKHGFEVKLRALDLGGDGTVERWEAHAADQRGLAQACDRLAAAIAERFAGASIASAAGPGDEAAYVRVGQNLLVNGDFEKGTDSPAGWERIDNLTSFWETERGRGRYVRLDTDVYLSQWQEWRERLAACAGISSAPAKIATTGHKYDTVAGTYGVRLYSDFIPVKPGATYAIDFDARGRTAGTLFFPKVFVKGYGEEGATQEYYSMYKAVRVRHPDRWEHFFRVFNPTARTSKVTHMRVMLFAYWPPAEYGFDNVKIYEVISDPSSAGSNGMTTP